MDEKKPKKSLMDYILTLVLIVAIGVFCYAGYQLFSIYMEYKAGTDEYEEIAQMAVTVRENVDDQGQATEKEEVGIKESTQEEIETKEEEIEETAQEKTKTEEVEKKGTATEEIKIEESEAEKSETEENLIEDTGNEDGGEEYDSSDESAAAESSNVKAVIDESSEVQTESVDELTILVIDLLKELVEAEEQLQTEKVQIENVKVDNIQAENLQNESENSQSVEEPQVLSKPEITESTEVTVTENDSASDSKDVSVEIPKDSVVSPEQTSAQKQESSQEETLHNIQETLKKISSILIEDKSGEKIMASVKINSGAARLIDSWLELFLYNSNPALYALEQLRECLSTAVSSLQTAIEIQKNGSSLQAPLEVDFQVLQGINSDVIGWLYVEALDGISYPMVQGEDNDRYLHHTYEGKYNFAGTIFIDCENSRDFSDCNTIVYGHNMKNGSMFGQLKNYVNKQETYAKSKYFWILTPEADYRYEIIAAYTTGVDSDTYTFFTSPGEKFLEYLENIRAWSVINTTSRKFTVRDKVVTLSTCTGNDSTRFVVQGVRVNTIKNKK